MPKAAKKNFRVPFRKSEFAHLKLEGKLLSLANDILLGSWVMDEQNSANRPRWLTDKLLEEAVNVYHPKKGADFGETEAVALLLCLGQLLDVTGMLNLESEHENKEIHRLG